MSLETEETIKINLELEYTLVNMPSQGLITEEFLRRVIPHEVALTTNSPIINAPIKRGGLRLEKIKIRRVQTFNKNKDVSK